MSNSALNLQLNSWFSSGSNSGGSSQCWVLPGGTAHSSYAANQPDVMYFWILDRKNPAGDPVFEAAAPDSSTVPNGLDQYLNDNHIMVAAQSSYVTKLPQGDLYTMLSENGGGVELRKTELLATSFACGVSNGLCYQLISIPGSGLVGIERQYYRNYASGGGGGHQGGLFQILCELVPTDDDGTTIYSPVEMS